MKRKLAVLETLNLLHLHFIMLSLVACHCRVEFSIHSVKIRFNADPLLTPTSNTLLKENSGTRIIYCIESLQLYSKCFVSDTSDIELLSSFHFVSIAKWFVHEHAVSSVIEHDLNSNTFIRVYSFRILSKTSKSYPRHNTLDWNVKL